ncbi:MAG: 30S ribosomal protein THX [Bacteroidetes bacterium]|nr:30S ribosomal protein THX [Bacteroidota bacterium]
MGRGDIRSRKGKIAAGSYGKARPHKVAAPAIPVKAAKSEDAEKAPKAKKAPAKKKAEAGAE